MSRVIKYLWIPTVIASIIFYLCCLIPISDIPGGFEFPIPIPADKIVHFLMFFGLSGVSALYYVYDNKGNVKISKLVIGAILIPILYGGIIEILQTNFFPPRTGDWFDFLADSLGSLATLPPILWLRQKLRLKYKNV